MTRRRFPNRDVLFIERMPLRLRRTGTRELTWHEDHDRTAELVALLDRGVASVEDVRALLLPSLVEA